MKTRRLDYIAPLDWRSLADFYRLRATPGVEIVDGETYRRTIELEGSAATIEVTPSRLGPWLDLTIDGSSTGDSDAIVARVRRMLDLDGDPAGVAAVLGKKRVLGKLVRARPGVRVPGAWDPFELVVRAILGQQVSVAAATTLAGRIATRFGALLDPPRRGLSRLFPSARALAETDLAGIGLTRARAETIRGFARAVATDALRLDGFSGIDEIVTRLVALPGIGPWTAHYVALRAFGERDAFPVGDLGLRRAMADARGVVPSVVELGTIAESWRPWRAYAAIYLWTSEIENRSSRSTSSTHRSAES